MAGGMDGGKSPPEQHMIMGSISSTTINKLKKKLAHRKVLTQKRSRRRVNYLEISLLDTHTKVLKAESHKAMSIHLCPYSFIQESVHRQTDK